MNHSNSAPAHTFPPKTDHGLPRWSTPARAIILFLAAIFWTYYVGRHSFGPTGGWRYLTVWGLTLNFLVAIWAFAGLWSRRLRKKNPLLPTALTVSTLVVILYWGLYAIDPDMVNADGALPWYSEFYMHLGTTIGVYLEAFCFNEASKSRLRSLVPVGLVAFAYVLWIDLVVAKYNTAPCGQTTDVCGYPYPFLNDLSVPTRLGFYVAGGIGFLLVSTAILTVWQRIRLNHPRPSLSSEFSIDTLPII